MNKLINVCEYIPVHDSGSKREFVDAIEKAIADYPDDARFGLEVEDDYDDVRHARIEVTYQRPETDKEEARRHAQEKDRRAWERSQYEALKKKFES